MKSNQNCYIDICGPLKCFVYVVLKLPVNFAVSRFGYHNSTSPVPLAALARVSPAVGEQCYLEMLFLVPVLARDLRVSTVVN